MSPSQSLSEWLTATLKFWIYENLDTKSEFKTSETLHTFDQKQKQGKKENTLKEKEGEKNVNKSDIQKTQKRV